MMLPMSFMVAIASSFFAADIMPMLYKACTKNPGLAVNYEIVFSVLMASFPAWCMMYVYSTLLTANGSLYKLNAIAFGGVIVNLSLNFLLITRYGAVGGAITSFTTQTLLAIAFILFAWRTIKLPFTLRWLLAHLSYLGISIAIAYGILATIHSKWLIQLAIFGIISIILMFLFRFVTISSLKQFANRKSEETV